MVYWKETALPLRSHGQTLFTFFFYMIEVHSTLRHKHNVYTVGLSHCLECANNPVIGALGPPGPQKCELGLGGPLTVGSPNIWRNLTFLCYRCNLVSCLCYGPNRLGICVQIPMGAAWGLVYTTYWLKPLYLHVWNVTIIGRRVTTPVSWQTDRDSDRFTTAVATTHDRIRRKPTCVDKLTQTISNDNISNKCTCMPWPMSADKTPFNSWSAHWLAVFW